MRTWTLITVAYNSARTLERYWTDDRPGNVEWIVVDNASTDDSREVAESLGARVVALEKNVGFARANNLGLRIAASEYIGFINPDVRVRYEDLDSLADLLDGQPMLLAPQLVNPDLSRQPNGRGAPVLATKVRNRLPLSAGLEGSYLLPVEDDSIKRVWWATGAVVLARHEVIDELGGWNERYFLYHEDSDLCMRAWAAGIPVLVAGGVLWEHAWARESATFRLKPIWHEIRSSVVFYSSYPQLIFGGAPAKRALSAAYTAVSNDWNS